MKRKGIFIEMEDIPKREIEATKTFLKMAAYIILVSNDGQTKCLVMQDHDYETNEIRKGWVGNR